MRDGSICARQRTLSGAKQERMENSQIDGFRQLPGVPIQRRACRAIAWMAWQELSQQAETRCGYLEGDMAAKCWTKHGGQWTIKV